MAGMETMDTRETLIPETQVVADAPPEVTAGTAPAPEASSDQKAAPDASSDQKPAPDASSEDKKPPALTPESAKLLCCYHSCYSNYKDSLWPQKLHALALPWCGRPALQE